jgi:hypothetical protein
VSQVRDDWEFQIDNRFPLKLHLVLKSHVESIHEGWDSQKLCSQCEPIWDRISNPDFQESYNTKDLQHRAVEKVCQLCGLLWKTCVRYGHISNDVVRFRRVGSVLLIDERTFPVLSICQCPGESWSILVLLPIC